MPVIDYKTEEILFTYEEYKEIREKMRGLTHFNADDFVIDANTNNEEVIGEAEELKKGASGKIPTKEKRKKVIEHIRRNISKDITTEILEDKTEKFIELIDTGSTGRGTNIPGDGDFDFMLRCASEEEKKEIISQLKRILDGKDTGGTSEFNIRYEDVNIEGLDEPVEVQITSENKDLRMVYSTDMCIRDRLNSIRLKYGEEQLNKVIDNILVAKAFLKENGVYKRNSEKFGGFGGIGTENWILQNGGSFIRAMQTFLENTVDENGEEVSFEEFKKRYPIYDFGQNHVLERKEHDHYVEGLTEEGFEKLKELFREKLKEYEILKEEQEEDKEKFFESVIDYTKTSGYKMSDMSQVYRLLAQLSTYKEKINEEGERSEDEWYK